MSLQPHSVQELCVGAASVVVAMSADPGPEQSPSAQPGQGLQPDHPYTGAAASCLPLEDKVTFIRLLLHAHVALEGHILNDKENENVT